MKDSSESPLKRLLVSFLELPPKPQPPSGTPESLKEFRAGPGFLRLSLASWAIKQVGTVVGIIAGLFLLPELLDFLPWTIFGINWIRFIELLAVVTFLSPLPVSYRAVKLDYEYRWYLLTDRSLRIREGLWTVREMTISLENIQNVGVKQGPIQRFFGIADVEVRTAGGGDHNPQEHGSTAMHIGVLRGIENAEQVRNEIMDRWKAARDGVVSLEKAPESQELLSQEPVERLLEMGAVLQQEASALGRWARKRKGAVDQV